MDNYSFRIATGADRPNIVLFMRRHWEGRHPLVELPDFFNYYYTGRNGALNFALCEQNGALAALAGFIPASQCERPDMWVSLWVADPAARGSGLELMAALPGLCGCRTLACNNIRPGTRPFYHFLGYSTGRVGHFYRQACSPPAGTRPGIPPVSGRALLTPLPSAEALRASGFVPPENANPYKDLWYIARRYFAFPRQRYILYAVTLPGQAAPAALLAARHMQAGGASVLRVADYIGPRTLLPELGQAIGSQLLLLGAEYADCYCAGVPAETMRAAGFSERAENGPDIIPNYPEPLPVENTNYYYFTSRPEEFVLFKADGDQDRAYVPLDEINSD